MEYSDFDKLKKIYTQVLIDIIVKTYNTKVFRSDLLFKSEIGVFIENPKYSPNEIFENWKENEYTIQLIMHEFTQEIDKVSSKKHNEYMKFFEEIKDLLVQNFMEKKADLKERLERINQYNHTKIFKEKQFKEWSKKARNLRDAYTNDKLEEFKIELKKLSKLYWK